MREKNFSISKFFEKIGVPKSLLDALASGILTSESRLCVDPNKPVLSLEEALKLPKDEFYFIQDRSGGFTMLTSMDGIEATQPFCIVAKKPLPEECPLQPGMLITYVCNLHV